MNWLYTPVSNGIVYFGLTFLVQFYNSQGNEYQAKLVLKPLAPDRRWKFMCEPLHGDIRLLSKKIPLTKYLNLQVWWFPPGFPLLFIWALENMQSLAENEASQKYSLHMCKFQNENYSTFNLVQPIGVFMGRAILGWSISRLGPTLGTLVQAQDEPYVPGPSSTHLKEVRPWGHQFSYSGRV